MKICMLLKCLHNIEMKSIRRVNQTDVETAYKNYGGKNHHVHFYHQVCVFVSCCFFSLRKDYVTKTYIMLTPNRSYRNCLHFK